MNYRKNGLRLLGLLAVAALSVMALAAASAQALTPGFLVAKKAVGDLLPTVTAEIDAPPSTLLVPGLNFKLNCQKFVVNKGIINTNIDADGELSYTECTTLSITKSPEEIKCEVKEPIVATALILPTELTNGEPAILAEKILAKINLTKEGDLTKECLLPFQTTVKGELCAKIRTINDPADSAPEGGLKLETNDTLAPLIFTNDEIQTLCVALTALEGTWATNAVSLLGKTKAEIEKLENEVPPKAFLDKLLFGTQPVTIDGAAILKLTGAHVGLTLGVSLF